MVDETATLEYLLETRHAELPLFLVRMTNTDAFAGVKSEPGRSLFREHLLYWWRLEEMGVLFGAGPVDFGTPNQEGFAILMGVTKARAIELAEAEPFHKAGWKVNAVREWQLNEGLVVEATRALAPKP